MGFLSKKRFKKNLIRQSNKAFKKNNKLASWIIMGQGVEEAIEKIIAEDLAKEIDRTIVTELKQIAYEKMDETEKIMFDMGYRVNGITRE